MIAFNIGSLLSSDQALRLAFDFDKKLELEADDECVLIENVRGHVECLKLPHEINVQIRDIRTRSETRCVRCTKVLEVAIEVPFIEREFLIDLPEEELEEGEEVFYVNRRRSELVIDELLRQEILLHFPARTVCFDGCKGLCDKCGADLNVKTCTCLHDTSGASHPFRIHL